MRNDGCDTSASGEQAAPAPAVAPARSKRASGATVIIPPRPAAEPLSPAALRARLAMLRPQPLRLRPAPRRGT